MDFTTHIDNIIKKYVPSKMTSSRTNLPWFTSKLKRMCRKKQRLYNRAKKHNNKQNWAAYTSLKTETLKAIRKSRREHINDILQTGLEKGDSGPFWRYIRSQRQDNTGIAPLKAGGKLHPDSTSKAEILNTQFKSVFTQEDTSDIPHLFGPDYPTIANLVVMPEGVRKLLDNINPKKAAGPDQIPCRILKELATELTPVLTAIFNQSLTSGNLPSIWTKAIVAPIFKKGDRCLPENYRPVSLTCVCCKLLEHIICTHIRQHLDKHNILSKFQHGFRSSHSCVSQLILTMHDLFTYRDKRIQIDMAILDFSKAFDTVPHEHMLGKLSFYGIKGPVLKWIAAFLCDREQCVVVDGKKSSQVSVDSGVPQGSVLGPLLFLLHINDLPSVVTSQVRLFADDCLLYRPIQSVDDQEALQRDLAALELWGDTWGMRFNAKKCNMMTIARARHPRTHLYSLNNHILQTVAQEKYLGITISNDLNWSAHINNITNKSNSKLGFLRRNLKRCPQKLKEIAYITLVRSTLEYAGSVWDPRLAKDRQSLEKIQRKAARFVKRDYRRRSSPTSMMAGLGWRDLETRRRDMRLTLLHKIIINNIAITTADLGMAAGDGRTKSNHARKLRAMGAQTPQLKESFAVRTIPEWNRLPATAAEAASPTAFKAQLARLPTNFWSARP